jgi:ketosteroid isomerase-like protein
MNKQVAFDFVKAINEHDTEEIISLMSNDHIFIDTYGNKQSKCEMESGWPGYFEWFPDYQIEISDIFEKENTIAVFGFASGTYHGKKTQNNENYWRIPAVWRAVVENDKIKIWQVYADSKIPFDIMNKA